MGPPKTMTTRRTLLLFVVLFSLFMLWVALTQPLVFFRFTTKIFTGYQLYLLQYPKSRFVEKVITATSKVTMATHFYYHTSEDIETVLAYYELQRPGFSYLHGSRVIIEPTFKHTACADETAFREIFQSLENGYPCIEVSIYPSSAGGTSIRISEHWFSMRVPGWLRRW
jgi:hypothetical protein